MNSQRESFEQWYDEETNNNDGVAYYVEIDGRYCFPDIELAFKAWQAATEQGAAEQQRYPQDHPDRSVWHYAKIDNRQPTRVLRRGKPE